MSGNYRFDDLSDDQICELWDRFYPRLRASIAERVRRIRRPVADESALALSAFHSMLRRAKAGQFPDLGDQESFWRLLRTIAIRKANDLHKHLWAEKRGGRQGALFQETDNRDEGCVNALEGAAANSSSSLDELEISETFNALMDRLPSDKHRDVVLLRLQGANTQEIAECLATTSRTVQRLLKSIHEDWESQLK